MSRHLPPDRPARTAAEERADRLSAELRANLRRRKDQARGREAVTSVETDGSGEAPQGRDA